MPVIDQIIRAIQASIDELLGEIERLRRALAVLTARESEPDRSQPAMPKRSAAGGSAAKSPSGAARPTPRARKASVPSAPSAPSASTSSRSSAAPARRTRTAPGVTRAVILAALQGGSAMTAGEIAAVTGLGRATVSTTLTRLATSGEIAKAARGYQIRHESETPVGGGAGSAEQTGTPTEPASA